MRFKSGPGPRGCYVGAHRAEVQDPVPTPPLPSPPGWAGPRKLGSEGGSNASPRPSQIQRWFMYAATASSRLGRCIPACRRAPPRRAPPARQQFIQHTHGRATELDQASDGTARAFQGPARPEWSIFPPRVLCGSGNYGREFARQQTPPRARKGKKGVTHYARPGRPTLRYASAVGLHRPP